MARQQGDSLSDSDVRVLVDHPDPRVAAHAARIVALLRLKAGAKTEDGGNHDAGGRVMTTQTEKQTVQEIVDDITGGREATAIWLHGIQCDASNFVDQYCDPNSAEWPRPIDWGLVENDGIPREFVAALAVVARYEVRL